MPSPEHKDLSRRIPVAIDTNRVAHFYDTGPLTRSIQNTRGFVNRNYELDDTYFLTVYQARSRRELEAVATIANGIDTLVPISRQIRGRDGYAMEFGEQFGLLTPKLPGKHYIGTSYTDRFAIPQGVHRSLAPLFWDLQRELSAVPEELRAPLKEPSRGTIGKMPEELPREALPLQRFAPTEGIPSLKYPDLIHDDLERQNILSDGERVTGIVDLDSIRSGDILYEFGHFMFNNVFCDPEANHDTAELYIKELRRADIIDPSDISSIYGHMYRFAVSDIVDFKDLLEHPIPGKEVTLDLDLLVRQYEHALTFASDFFTSEQTHKQPTTRANQFIIFEP